MRDRSLDEFAEADAGADDDGKSAPDSDAGGDGDPTNADGTARATDAEAERPADGDTSDADESTAVTYEWTPGGAACGVCGASVETRWRDGEAFVCADCKEW